MSGKYDDDLLPDTELSPRTEKALEKTRSNLRKRTVERGIVQFRADSEFMEALLNLAEQKKVPPGVLCREWVWQMLQNQKNSVVSPSALPVPHATPLSTAPNGMIPVECIESVHFSGIRQKLAKDAYLSPSPNPLQTGLLVPCSTYDESEPAPLWQALISESPKPKEKYLQVRADLIRQLVQSVAELEVDIKRTDHR